MRKFLGFVTITCFLVIMISSVAISKGSPKADFVVAANGNDSNPGTWQAPFATLEKARDAVRAKVADGLKEVVVVLVRGGVYYLEKPLVFGAQDSGTTEHKIVYGAYPGEKVTLSGGRPLTGWKKGPENMWTLELPEVKNGKWYFRQLFVDDQRMPRGRYPETGFFKIKTVSPDSKILELDKPLPKPDLGGTDTEVVVVQNWSVSREIIDSSSGNSLTAVTPIGWVDHCACLPKPGMSVFLENRLDFVKKPGQWYLDRKSGVLHYKAAEGEDPNRRRFVAPVLEHLVKLEGTKEKPIRNVYFGGIDLEHAAWKMPAIGYGGIQACYHGTSVDEEATFAVPAAVEMAYAQQCGFSKCRLSKMGGSGLGLGEGCCDNKIIGCEFSDIGGNGVAIGHMKVKNPLHADWSDPADVPKGNEVSDCSIHNCGVTFYGAVGIFDAMTQDTRIIHNELWDLPYTGISTGYIWGTEPTSQKNCLIAYNHIHDVMKRVYDGGAIYTLGYQPGSILRGNLMHGVGRSSYAHGNSGNNGIFFDEGSKGFLIEDNIIYDTINKPIRFNKNPEEWHTWRNNFFGVKPDDPKFPHDIAKKAGVR